MKVDYKDFKKEFMDYYIRSSKDLENIYLYFVISARNLYSLSNFPDSGEVLAIFCSTCIVLKRELTCAFAF